MIKGYFIYKDFFLKMLFLGSFFIFFAIQSEETPNISEINSSKVTNLVQKAVKKSFTQKYPITYASVESSMYLQQIIANYNLHIKHAITGLLKKELEQGHTYTKELSYLLGQLNTVTTIKKAIVVLARAISAYKTMIQENSSYQEDSDWHESAYSTILLQCSVVLINVAREQLLLVLHEIHDSLLYWRDQKSHPVKYFFQKSPIKWVKGKRQADEIALNIKKFEQLEYKVNILLGRLTKHIYAFDVNGNVNDCYQWINTLLSILTVIDTDNKQVKYESHFEEIAEKLKFQLTKISSLKNVLLSKISSAIKPGHFARNWLKYSAALAAVYAARYYYLQNTEDVMKVIGPEALHSYASQAQAYTKEYVITPIRNTVKTIFIGRTAADQEKALKVTKDELKKVLEELSKPQKGWFGTYGYVNGKPLSQEEKDYILAEDEKGNTVPLLSLLHKINKDVSSLVYGSAEPLLEVIFSYLLLHGAYTAEKLQVVWNLGILSPALFFTGFGLAGLSKLYQSTTARDFSTIRLALLNINSLFIESEAPLSDYDYGRLIYLLQGLKNEALRYLTPEDMRDDFLKDIAKLESHNFNVETKREIIKNMFMKYPFLTINAKSA